jgi:hypothetical protein
MHEHDKICGFDGGEGTLAHLAGNERLRRLIRRYWFVLLQPGHVGDADQAAVETDLGRECIARRAGDVGDDRARRPGQGVEERALAGVGAADQDERRLVREGLESGAFIDELTECAIKRGCALGDLAGRNEADVLLGEVDAGLDQGERFRESIHDGTKTAGQLAAEELACGGELLLGSGGDGGGDALGAGEVEAAVEVRPCCELTRLGGGGAALGQFIEKHSGEHRAAGDVKLDEIFAGVAARGAEAVEPAGATYIAEIKPRTHRGACGRDFRTEGRCHIAR